MPLVTSRDYNLVPQFSNIGKGFAQGQQIANQFQLREQRQAQEQRAASQFDLSQSRQATQDQQANARFEQEQSVLRAGALNNLAKNMKSIPPERWDSFIDQNAEELGKFNIDASVLKGQAKSVQDLDEVIASTGALIGGEKPQAGFTLSEGQQRFDAQGNLIASGAKKGISELERAKIDNLNAETNTFKGINTESLDSLVVNASPELQEKAKAAFKLSGGGDKGVKALQSVLKQGVETERRAAAPQTLAANFPKASKAEMEELQAVVDAAKDTESGFKEASKLRDKQRQVAKGKVFQSRAVDLLDRILAAPELNDVVGSVQGSDESLIPFGGQKIRGDNESEIIADIEEAGNILTADNLDIMSGVLSETDIKIIANLAGGALNRKRGEEAFIRDVTELRDRMKSAVGVVDGNKLPTGTTDNNDGTFTLPDGRIVRKKRG